MRKTIIANSERTYAALLRELREAYDSAKYITVRIDTGQQRTDQQRKAIEVFCRELADVLNSHGLDMQAVFNVKEVSVPWSQESAKEVLFKPIMTAMFQVESTTELERGQCGKVHAILCKNLSEKLGITCPEWPSKEREHE